MATLWKTPEELAQLVREELFTAVVGDIMDQMGLTSQFLPPQIRALKDDMVVFGLAMPVLEADCLTRPDDADANSVLGQPFGLMLDALDDLKPNEIYICTGASPDYALWGELMTARALYLGAAGAVLNGYIRDTPGIKQMGFPTFSLGAYAQDQAPRGKVIDFRVPIKIGGVRIETGDLIFGDLEGVCVVPRDVVDEVFAKALEKARAEKTVKKAIEAGMGAREAFEKYQIL